MKQSPAIWVISDDSHRAVQSMAVAEQLNPEFRIVSVAEIELRGIQQLVGQAKPDVLISCGTEAAPYAVALKQLFREVPLAVSVLDPGADHALFDVIAVPSHEPKPHAEGLFLTTGYLNKVTAERLTRARSDYEADKYGYLSDLALPRPYFALLVGGQHVGDEVKVEDVAAIAEWLNKASGSVLATTSPRTSMALVQALNDNLEAPHFIYDFKSRRVSPNPYAAMLAIADHVIVTGDSARMISEACSSGKPVWIYAPEGRFFQYQALHQAMIDGKHAARLTDFDRKPSFELGLSEARRLAAHIQQKILDPSRKGQYE